jgi:membrane protease YdiL (CAAX protease family)
MKGEVREAVAVWAAVILGLAAVQLLGLLVAPLRSLTGALAVAAFLYVPIRFLERRGQDAHDAGWRFDRLGQDLLWALLACAVVLPLFGLGFWVFTAWLDRLPEAVRGLLAPYAAGSRPLHLHLPLSWDFAGQVAGNAAVAFSEEFFYRGYLTLRLEESWPPSRRVLGAPMGRAALLAAALFAVGHLLTPAPWRLAVFFPALLFAWLRARTGTIVGASLCHFLCNIWLLVLESS